MCALNGSSVHLMEPWELPEGALKQAQEEDYLRVKKLSNTFINMDNKEDKPSVAGKLYSFSQEPHVNSKPTLEDSMVR
ncbi:hypothetical protein LJC56_08665 [Christensenellaceae bacterium OttesenSCG-928-K19]|nr:hypothetical protein [Christensenellaceae bacterium OttesenSCG-928-K19]